MTQTSTPGRMKRGKDPQRGGQLSQEVGMSTESWRSRMGERVEDLLRDFIFRADELPTAA